MSVNPAALWSVQGDLLLSEEALGNEQTFGASGSFPLRPDDPSPLTGCAGSQIA